MFVLTLRCHNAALSVASLRLYAPLSFFKTSDGWEQDKREAVKTVPYISEKKIIKDPVTGTQLTFLTSKPAGDSKIYQTHNQWTADGNWVIFRSGRVRGEAMAVNEKTGDIVQVSEGGYTLIRKIRDRNKAGVPPVHAKNRPGSE